MGGVIPKQFMLLDNKPILVHTLEKFLESEGDAIILALPAKDMDYWSTQVVPHFNSLIEAIKLKKLIVVEGGETRYQSVRNGLNSINSNN